MNYIQALGVKDAFSSNREDENRGYYSHMLLHSDGINALIDCPTDVRFKIDIYY